MKKIINSVVVASLLLLGTTSSIFGNEVEGGNFGAFVITPETADGTVSGYQLDGTFMLGLYGGDKQMFGENLGLYGGFDISVNTTDETDTSDKAIYSYTNINLGVTYGLSKELTLLGGLGLSMQEGQFVYYGTRYKTKADENELNFQVGVMYEFADRLGALIKYDTASESVGGGITYSFKTM